MQTANHQFGHEFINWTQFRNVVLFPRLVETVAESSAQDFEGLIRTTTPVI